MPTYDYECTACGHRFEELQSFSDSPLTKCPKCKKNKLTRLFGGGGAIIFKGGGFYETDYRRAGDSQEAGKESGSETGKESGSSETKPSDGKTESPGAGKGDTKTEPTSPPPPSKTSSASGSKGKKSPKSSSD